MISSCAWNRNFKRRAGATRESTIIRFERVTSDNRRQLGEPRDVESTAVFRNLDLDAVICGDSR